jgi:diguanylate cyclase (GGDEF)-like protein
MVLDAILITLACILVYVAYLEVADSRTRTALDKAELLMLSTDNFANDEDLFRNEIDENGTYQLKRRLDAVAERVKAANSSAEISIFSAHPNFAAVSSRSDDFRKRALSAVTSGATDTTEELTMNGKDVMRVAKPFLAFRDCRRCSTIGIASYKKGDVIGIREVIVPLGDDAARTIHELLFALAMLGTALMVYLGMVIPKFRRYRQERADISVRAQSFEKQAATDPLTGLHNRRYFEQALETYLEEFNSVGSQLGLLILDLDHFKTVNDTYGHDTGDLLLREISLRLKAITREHDVVARIGGEEFAVITPYVSPEQLMRVAERYREAIQDLRISMGNVCLRPTVSIGVATNAQGEQHGEELFTAADRKLYQAKRDGRNRVAA